MTKQDKTNLVLLFVGSILIVWLVACLSGCRAKTVADVEQVRPLTGIASAVARADVRADTIITLSGDWKKYEPKTFAEFIAAQATGIKADVVVVNRELSNATDAAATAQDRLKEANARIVKLDTDLAAERDHWLGRKARVLMAWIIGGLVTAWAVLGVLAVVLGVSSPAGIGMIWSKRIIRALPLANVFSWLRDRASGTRGIA